ncbi:MAG: methylmalonyl-CoA mutase family protein, partial [Chloroflexota bacterium]
MPDARKLGHAKGKEAHARENNGHAREARKDPTNLSNTPIVRVYTQRHLEGFDYKRDMSLPGEYPFLRGVHATGYRGKLWTMRQFAGFGDAEDTNQRYKYLLQSGGAGLSVALDLPTLMGYDSDHAASKGEFGKCGVAVSSLRDMEVLFDGISLDKITTSMTI